MTHSTQDIEASAAARAAVQDIMLVVDEASVYMVVAELLRGMEDKDDRCRSLSASLAGAYVQQSTVDLEASLPTIMSAQPPSRAPSGFHANPLPAQMLSCFCLQTVAQMLCLPPGLHWAI